MVIALFLALQSPSEADFYPVVGVEPPANVVLEVGGFALLEDGRPLVCTRRGEVWLRRQRVLCGRQERRLPQVVRGPAGSRSGSCATASGSTSTQRGELSQAARRRRRRARRRARHRRRPLAHQRQLPRVRLRPGAGGRTSACGSRSTAPSARNPSGTSKWRGFALAIDPASGAWQPICAGLRSPCGVTTSPWGEVFYTDNQGEWVGTNKLCLLEPGDFYGHPWGVASTKLPEWKFGEIAPPPNKILWPEAARTVPHLQVPAVWFPYDVMGRSAAGFVWDTEGRFGPFFRTTSSSATSTTLR